MRQFIAVIFGFFLIGVAGPAFSADEYTDYSSLEPREQSLENSLEESEFASNSDREDPTAGFLGYNALSIPHPPLPPPNQNPVPDLDGDGISDLDEGFADNPPKDSDRDGLPDALDPDSDDDGIPDADEAEGDIDKDGEPDATDSDSDNDGIPDGKEGIEDADGDGIPNHHDNDSDNDGVGDREENRPDDPFNPNPNNGDADKDGIPDAEDPDSDNDGTQDGADPDYDNDNDGIPNGSEGNGNQDTDGDGIPDNQDTDSDNDGHPDAIEKTRTLMGTGFRITWTKILIMTESRTSMKKVMRTKTRTAFPTRRTPIPMEMARPMVRIPMLIMMVTPLRMARKAAAIRTGTGFPT
jgi:hypothetical protein